MSDFKSKLAAALGVPLPTEEVSRAEAERLKREQAEDEAAEEHAATARRYPGAEVLPLPAARALLAEVPPPPEREGVDGIFDPAIFGLPSVQIIRGDTELDELHLEAQGSHLIVEGSLRVRGILRQAFGAGALLVLGDLEAQHIVTTGELDVTGSLKVSGTLYGNTTNYGTSVWGPAEAAVALSNKGHYFSFWGGATVGLLIDAEGGTPNLEHADHDPSTMGEVLRPEVGNAFDAKVVLQVLEQHGTLLAE